VYIKYQINKSDHFVHFLKKKQINKINKIIDNVESDKNILFVYDDAVKKSLVKKIIEELQSSGCNLLIIECKGSKINKNEKLLFKILDVLLKNNFSKRSIVISFGGGVIGDVTALASSLYLRGLIYFCIPTTITSIVDSSIGGKTAINYRGVINSIGNYYHPKSVIILEDIIVDLPDREYFSGFAEIIKCGLIDNNKILGYLKRYEKNLKFRNINNVFEICSLTLKIKIKFFLNDIYEKNSRLMLNFGHTFAHSIEMSIENKLNKDLIRHGEAVGLGILSEIYYANKRKNNLYKMTAQLLSTYNLPTNLEKYHIPIDKTKLQGLIYKNLFLDKKKINKYPRYISLKKIGIPKILDMEDYDFINDTILKVIL
jgi:3-dehydroquinate synthase